MSAPKKATIKKATTKKATTKKATTKKATTKKSTTKQKEGHVELSLELNSDFGKLITTAACIGNMSVGDIVKAMVFISAAMAYELYE